jgi:two-component system, cell cycle sensor histidine kinase and response regulator CckA
VVLELNSDVASMQPEQDANSGQALRDSEARYRRLFETAQDGILILDAQRGSITDVNPYLMKLLDYSRQEFLGKALWDIGLFKDIEASKEAFKELQAKQYVRYEDLPLKTRAGQTINVEFVSNVYGVNGDQVIQCNIRDITKRKHAEQSEQRILQAQKMEAVGQLAGGLAHDFNNLLGVILGYCELLADREDLAEPARQMIGNIGTAGLSAKKLTQDLLAFSRRKVLQPVVMDLNEAVDHIHPMLERLIGDDMELDNVLSDDLGTITADPNHIEQVLMNLAINARDAMPKGGKITFETTNVEIDETYAQQHVPMNPGRYVMLSVRDTGTGMDLETRSQIFDPFFTTKDCGKGTGLGLSTVFGIVKQSGGTIGVYSEPGKGTAFKIHFPRCDKVPMIVEPIKPKQLRGGTETILLVDDATPLRMLTKLILEQCGYTVLDSGEPAEALRIAKGHKGSLPLMITDVVMPSFTGRVLAERLTADRPETKVLFTSGYADDETAKYGILGVDNAFLEKPFTRDDLVRKVRELLDLPRQAKQDLLT